MTSEYDENAAPAEAEFSADTAENLEPQIVTSDDPNWEGVPLDERRDILARIYVLFEGLTGGGAIDSVLSEARQLLTTSAQRFPDASIWDQLRGAFAIETYDREGKDRAVGMLVEIQSPIMMASAIDNILDKAGDLHIEKEFMQSLLVNMESLEPDHRLTVLRELVCARTITEPRDVIIDDVVTLVQAEDPSYDPFEVWFEVQHHRNPDDGWWMMREYAKQEHVWQGVPMRDRQSILAHFRAVQHEFTSEPSTEFSGAIVESLESLSQEFPSATVWDDLRHTLAADMVDRKSPLFVFDFARALGDARKQKDIVERLIAADFTDDALELACIIKDPVVLADVLRNGNWPDGIGSRRLAEITDQYGDLN